MDLKTIKVIDSHTAGEPTRVVIGGGPALGAGTLNERLKVFRNNFDDFRRSVILEPRGYEAMVGALLCAPDDPDCATAVLFFNNEGYLNMCGHGTIGVAATLAYLNKIEPGSFRIQAPAGTVDVNLHSDNEASFTNVESFVAAKDVVVQTPNFGSISGHVAFGGNWFFVASPPCPFEKSNLQQLLSAAAEIRGALASVDVPNVDAPLIDHIEFFVPDVKGKSSRNFVVCPGGEFDRSPCGTGTSAVLAFMATSGFLQPAEVWTQQSLTGGVFRGAFQWADESKQKIIPTVRGEAYVCAESTLIQHVSDPYRFGNEIRNAGN